MLNGKIKTGEVIGFTTTKDIADEIVNGTVEFIKSKVNKEYESFVDYMFK